MSRRDPPGDPSPGTQGPGCEGERAPDLEQLARDWITLWQSELAAAAVDRETQETWQAMLALWANAATAMLGGLMMGGPMLGGPMLGGPMLGGVGSPDEPGRPGAAAATRPAPAHAAPDARDAEVERLAGRVRELERRLADLERGGG